MDFSLWAKSFNTVFVQFWEKVASFLPNLLATILIVIVGFLFAKLVAKWSAKLIEKLGFNSLCKKLGVNKIFELFGFKHQVSELIGKLLFLFCLLFIFVAASETLGLERFSTILDQFILYLPKLFGAIVITFIGLFIAKKGKEQLEASLDAMGLEYGTSAGKLLNVLVLFITFSLVIGQLELETALLNTIFTILIASLGFALALALGLGTKSVANSVISGIYAREQLLPGDEVEFEGFVGLVVSVNTVNTIIEDSDGKRLSIPNQDLLNKKFITTKMGCSKSE